MSRSTVWRTWVTMKPSSSLTPAAWAARTLGVTRYGSCGADLARSARWHSTRVMGSAVRAPGSTDHR
jgi:hypothetical protein